MWCETSGSGRSRTPGPVLGIHLGMSGRMLITDAGGRADRGRRLAGPRTGAGAPSDADAQPGLGPLHAHLRRRRHRCACSTSGDSAGSGSIPISTRLGPDAQLVDRRRVRATGVGRSTAPVKARLLDQSVIAGVGNLLADETLWQAKISPRRPADELTPTELRPAATAALQRATEAAIEHGGVHTGEIIEFRGTGPALPALRHRDDRGDRRRPDHLVVPEGAALTAHPPADQPAAAGPGT